MSDSQIGKVLKQIGAFDKLTSDEIDKRIKITQSNTSSLQEIIEALKQIGAIDKLIPQRKDESKKEWEDRIKTIIMREKNQYKYEQSLLADPNGNAMKNVIMQAPENFEYSHNPSFYPKTKGGYRKKTRKTHRRRKVHRRSRKN